MGEYNILRKLSLAVVFVWFHCWLSSSLAGDDCGWGDGGLVDGVDWVGGGWTLHSTSWDWCVEKD